MLACLTFLSHILLNALLHRMHPLPVFFVSFVNYRDFQHDERRSMHTRVARIEFTLAYEVLTSAFG